MDTSGRVHRDGQADGAEPHCKNCNLKTREAAPFISAEQKQTYHSERMFWTLYSILLDHTDGNPLYCRALFFDFVFFACCSFDTVGFWWYVTRECETFATFRLSISYSRPNRINLTIVIEHPSVLQHIYRCLYVEEHLTFGDCEDVLLHIFTVLWERFLR